MAEATIPTYDIIIVGGGVAACVIAGRLAVADPTLKILVLEAGPHSKNNPDHGQPAYYYPSFARHGEIFTMYVSKPHPDLNDRPAVTMTRRCLGGGSAVNWMVYCRAAASNSLGVPFYAAEYGDTLDDIWQGDEAEIKPFVDQWFYTGQGLLAYNGIDAGIRIRPHADDLKEIGPLFTERWKQYFANASDKPIVLLTIIAGYIGFKPPTPRQKIYCIIPTIAYPMSTAYTHISSGVNPYAILDYDFHYFHEYEPDA